MVSPLSYPAKPARPNDTAAGDDGVDYPDSDGQPMSDNTLQFDWIVLLKENLDAEREDFVGGDLLWYPIQGDNKTRVAPDVLVAPGRPKGYRGSYKQWVEGGQPPAVVIEVLSPSNTLAEITWKSEFYARHGVREFIVVDPFNEVGWAALYTNGVRVESVPSIVGWTSPTLGIRFEHADGHLVVFGASGARFEKLGALRESRDAALARAEQEAARAEHEAARAERLAARLRELGLDAD